MSTAIGVHQGIPVRKSQLRGYRKDRMHYGLRTVAAGTILLLIIVVVALH